MSERPPTCPRCKYDLGGLPVAKRMRDGSATLTCPECGWTGRVRDLDAWQPPEAKGWGYVIAWWCAAVGFVVVLGAVLVAIAVALRVFL